MVKNRGDKFEILRLQYQECYENLRHHNNAIWKIPSLIIVINGAIIIGVFRWLELELIRILLLWISVFVSLALFMAITKHHYYYEIELETLNLLEDALGTKRIKRETFVDKNSKYWVINPPNEPIIPQIFTKFFNFFEKWSSHICFMVCGFLIFIVQLILAIYMTNNYFVFLGVSKSLVLE
ncbi:MAG: hypothetical protein KAT05_14700, partial [Spirochaetes bacterium]|nr:hypothetical protein [Spirochaetota bacterium]